MNEMRLTDEQIRTALTPAASVLAPTDLGSSIRAAIDEAPQRSGRFVFLDRRSVRLVVRLAVVALLLAALVAGAVIVGSLIDRSSPIRPSAVTYHGGPERTGIMPGPAPSNPSERCWPDVTLIGGVRTYMPTVADGVVVTGDTAGGVTAVDLASGATRWQVTPGGPIYAGPSMSGETVLVGSDDGVLRALTIEGGSVAWAFQTGARVRTSPAIIDRTAYFGSDDGNLYAVDVATGEERWRQRTPGPIGRSPALVDGVIYAGSDDPEGARFGAFSAASGRRLWEVPIGAGAVGSPVTDGIRVYVATGLDNASAVHQVKALDLLNGEELWNYMSPSGQAMFLGAAANGLLFIVSHDGSVQALEATTGTPAWTAPVMTEGPIGSVAAWVDGLLVVASSDNHVYALDAASGEEAWRFEVIGEPSTPAVVDGRVLVATSLGLLTCIGG